MLFGSDKQVNEFLTGIYRHFQLEYPKFHKMDNLSKLGWLTAELLLKDNFNNGDYALEKVGVMLANANSSLDDDLKYWDTATDTASPALFVYTLPNIVAGEICIRHHFKGEQSFFVCDTFDSALFEQQVNYWLHNNIADCCVCGWVDVIQEQYKSVLFLVEKTKKESGLQFSAQNMEMIFNTVIA